MLFLALSLALASQALPSGTVVAGVSTHEGTRTDVTAFLPDGSARVLFVEEHAAGFVPKGSLDASQLALAVQHDGADGASVVVLDLVSNTRVVAGERAIASQAPRSTGQSVTWVRAAETPERSTFDVVSARDGNEEVLASIDGAWLAPLRGDARFLHITTDGVHRVVALRGTSLDVERSLGKGPLRLPALTSDGTVVIERTLGNGRARLERAGVTLREGIAGMDPLIVDGARDIVVAGAGTKRAAIVTIEKTGERIIELGRAGVATPVAAALIDGNIIVVARVDRGRSLPPETWLIGGRGPRALATGGSIEVYGVIRDGGAQ